MILRRIKAHVEKENWFAVAIDFLIVVVGVFIGIQVANWNEHQQNSERREAAIERLHDEAVENVVYFRNVVEMYEEGNGYRSEAIQRLIDKDWGDADSDNMSAGIMSISLYPSAAPARSVYDEVIATGLFAELGDADLRMAISDYYSMLDFLQGQIAYLRMGYRAPLWEHEHIHLEFTPGTTRERDYVIDFEALSNDTDFIERVIAGNNSIRAMTSWWRGARQAAEDMCAETARITNKPCEQPEADSTE